MKFTTGKIGDQYGVVRLIMVSYRPIWSGFFSTMSKEAMNQEQKGAAFLKQVGSIDFAKVPVVRSIGNLINEFGEKKHWDSFVALPVEIADLFPGSYIDPSQFLRSLTASSERLDEHKAELLGTRMGSPEHPVLSYNEQQGESMFQLRIRNGATNEHALTMTKLAHEAQQLAGGFANENYEGSVIRAQYQEAMRSNIATALKQEEIERSKGKYKNYAVRIHDDCGATGESVVNFLLANAKDPEILEKYKRRGVKVVIDGPITAQAVLYMKSFSQHLEIPMDIDAGHMAFGLTAGEVVEGKRRHGNYITYPSPLEVQLPVEARQIVAGYRNETGDDPQVVGDMGEAEKGIEGEHVEALRSQMNHGSEHRFCLWNDLRTDTWGVHPHHEEGVEVSVAKNPAGTDFVYLARGGYVPLIFDKLYNSQLFEQANIVVLRASRFTATDEEAGQELGFGVGFMKADGVRVSKSA